MLPHHPPLLTTLSTVHRHVTTQVRRVPLPADRIDTVKLTPLTIDVVSDPLHALDQR